jgi:hypothetical protein
VADLLADGRGGHRVVSAIVWRTCWVQDPDAQAAIDAVAEQARTLGVLSDYQTRAGGRFTDAQILIRRLSLMARQVCNDDPRTMAQRRAAAPRPPLKHYSRAPGRR